MAPASDIKSALLITLFLVLVLIVFPAWVLSRLSIAKRRRREARRPKDLALPPRTDVPRIVSLFGGRITVTGGAASGCLWLLFLGAFFSVFWFVAPSSPPRPDRRPSVSNQAFPAIVVVTCLTAGLAGWVGFQLWRNHDPALTAAYRAYAAGRCDEAVATVRDLLEVKPTANRANLLAIMLMNMESWDDAYKHLLQAQELGLDRSTLANNMAVVLRRLGRPSDALDAIEPFATGKTPSVVMADTYAHILLDLGRLEEALAQIKRVEVLFRNQAGSLGGSAETMRQSIDQARSRYEELLGKKSGTAVEADDELA